MNTLQGFGLGLRTEHYQALAEPHAQGPDWLEIISENYLVDGGKPLHNLDRLRALYPMVMHGVSLNIGGSDPLNLDYLRSLKALSERVQPAWISDHLCFGCVDHRNLHDLLPLPYTQEALAHVAARVGQVQDLLGRPLVLENVSSYVSYAADEMDEADFIAALVRQSGCQLLLDVNNIYVSSRNHGFDAQDFVRRLPASAVVQIHLAGHDDQGDIVIDTHDHAIADAVWQLYAYTLEQLGPRPTMIERDDHIPPLPELLQELTLARAWAAQTTALPA